MGAPPSIYDIPSGEGLQPTSGWYNSIAPEVRQGMWEPWNDASNQMMANMSGIGQLGSPGAGMSGAALNAQGSLYADAGQQVGMQAWNMMQPGQQAMWQANLGRNTDQYNTSLIPWQQNYSSGLQDYQQANQLMGVHSSGGPTGIISQQGNPWAGALSGGLQGGLAAYSMFGGQNQQPAAPPAYTPFQTGTPNYMPNAVDQWQYSSPARY